MYERLQGLQIGPKMLQNRPMSRDRLQCDIFLLEIR
jgi:hypothetical protein